MDTRRPGLRTIATVMAALAVPVTLLMAQLVGVYYRSSNPDNVDITQGLAYLRPIMVAAWLTFGVMVALVVALISKMYKRDGNFAQAKLPLSLLVVIVIVMGGWMAVNSYNDQVVNEYRQSQERSR